MATIDTCIQEEKGNGKVPPTERAGIPPPVLSEMSSYSQRPVSWADSRYCHIDKSSHQSD